MRINPINGFYTFTGRSRVNGSLKQIQPQQTEEGIIELIKTLDIIAKENQSGSIITSNKQQQKATLPLRPEKKVIKHKMKLPNGRTGTAVIDVNGNIYRTESGYYSKKNKVLIKDYTWGENQSRRLITLSDKLYGNEVYIHPGEAPDCYELYDGTNKEYININSLPEKSTVCSERQMRAFIEYIR